MPIKSTVIIHEEVLRYRLASLKMLEGTRTACENNHLTQVTGNFPTCPSWNSSPGCGERHLAVSDNALNQSANRTGPVANGYMKMPTQKKGSEDNNEMLEELPVDVVCRPPGSAINIKLRIKGRCLPSALLYMAKNNMVYTI